MILFNLFGIIAFCLTLFVIYSIKQIPSAVEKSISDERQYRNNRQLQIDNYFRQISGKGMQDVLIDWIKIINDSENSVMKNTKKLQQLMNNTLAYSSARTIRLIANFSQYTFLNNKKGEADYKLLMYVAMIVSNLKKEFSGEDVDPIDLLKVKYSDYSDIKDEIQILFNEINDELNI